MIASYFPVAFGGCFFFHEDEFDILRCLIHFFFVIFLSLAFFLRFSSRYYCARLSVGTCAGAPTLAVSLTPNKETVRRGDNLEVRCQVTGDPSALVSWRRIGGSLSRNAQVLGNLLRYFTFIGI